MLNVPRYAESLPAQLRFHPFGRGRAYTQAYAPLSDRKFDLVMTGPWVNTLTFKYDLPPGYAVKDMPAEVKDETKFGRLRITYKVENGKLVCDGEIAFTEARIAVADYPAFREWLGRVDQHFSRRLVALKPADGTQAAR
jgi:hypothetical protein